MIYSGIIQSLKFGWLEKTDGVTLSIDSSMYQMYCYVDFFFNFGVQGCYSALGMGPEGKVKIKDEQITASSYRTFNSMPAEARLSG